MTEPTAALSRPRIIGVLFALLFVWALLVAPDRLEAMKAASFARVPVELPVLLLLLLLVGGAMGAVIRSLTTIALFLLLVAKLANAGMYFASGRPFDLVLDLDLLGAVRNLMSGTLGNVLAVLGIIALINALFGLLFLIWISLRMLGRFAQIPGPQRIALAAFSAISIAGFVLDTPGVTANASNLLISQVTRAQQSAVDLDAFHREATSDPITEELPADLLTALAGNDVYVVFFESYGGTLLTDPAFKARTETALAKFDEALARKHMVARSGFLTSTTLGGQSWLAHSTLLSGLRIDNQRRYQALVRGTHGTLVKDFKRAGWTTEAVMPGITMPWPEGQWFGFDRVMAAKDLGYRGKSFDWVTMPDQFTLESFERLKGDGPVMAQITLLSSHIPWAPLPSLVEWEKIGDGTIFNAQVDAGEPPDTVWRSPDQVRDHYLRSIEYVLATLSSWIERYGNERTVVIVVGDHQPIPWVAGKDVGHSVPVHIIAGNPSTLARIDGWRWTNGMRPSLNVEAWPMEEFRKRFVAAFSGSGSS
ncbi:sulfatase-like hydrolase/transferase [Flaviflagellibacter deserti]|uniref:Sulfatase-like hydrolase/transferase n=1 Tax=Flaviflagellibacter deserti TaxID=2267266 RepID=A0ABV9YWL5_9HYPH